MGTDFHTTDSSLWVYIPIGFFILLNVYFLLKFFSVFFDFIQAKGCLTVGLVALVGIPASVALSLISGSLVLAIILICLSVIGLVTGYIAYDSEGNVGKFGLFIMIVSAISLVTALLIVLIHILF